MTKIKLRNPKNKLQKILLVVLVAVAIGISIQMLFLKSKENKSIKSNDSTISLSNPFLAWGQEPKPEGVSFLEKEAGIAAYTQVTHIDLDTIKANFKTVEEETDKYIIGSVGLKDYGDTEDVHCYVHKGGWAVAYYLKEDPVAKIIDWKRSGEGTLASKLEEGLGKAGVSFGEVKYYDFRYPDANKLMIITKRGESSFKLKIPKEFIVSERSYLLQGRGYAYLDLDGNNIARAKEGAAYGTVVGLKSDVFHVVGFRGDLPNGAIVLVYQEP